MRCESGCHIFVCDFGCVHCAARLFISVFLLRILPFTFLISPFTFFYLFCMFQLPKSFLLLVFVIRYRPFCADLLPSSLWSAWFFLFPCLISSPDNFVLTLEQLFFCQGSASHRTVGFPTVWSFYLFSSWYELAAGCWFDLNVYISTKLGAEKNVFLHTLPASICLVLSLAQPQPVSPMLLSHLRALVPLKWTIFPHLVLFALRSVKTACTKESKDTLKHKKRQLQAEAEHVWLIQYIPDHKTTDLSPNWKHQDKKCNSSLRFQIFARGRRAVLVCPCSCKHGGTHPLASHKLFSFRFGAGPNRVRLSQSDQLEESKAPSITSAAPSTRSQFKAWKKTLPSSSEQQQNLPQAEVQAQDAV